LVPGVEERLGATKPEFRCARDDALSTRLRRQRRKLGLTVDAAASLIGVRRWTWGLWENGGQRPQARYQAALDGFLADGL
jgi:DNA-binding XRE family transcriptional regulator